MTKLMERRAFSADIEIRTAADGTVGLHGYAAVFDSEAFDEVIRSGAFSRTLTQRDNVRLLVNHEGVPVASTGAGTMSLAVDERGLVVDVPNLDLSNPTVQELVSAMSRGDIDQMSFAGYFLDAKRNDLGLREVREVQLLDVSVVTFPWYDETSVTLNSRSRARRSPLLQRLAPAGQTSWADIADDLAEAIPCPVGEWLYVVDVGDAWVVWVTSDDWDCYWMASWSADGSTITLGTPGIVVPTYVPQGDPAAAASDEPDPEGMSLDMARAYALAGRVPPRP